MKEFVEEKIGGATLIKGDALEVLEVLHKKGYMFDAVITDPPYGVTRNAADLQIPLDLMWEALKKVTKVNTPIILFGQDKFTARCMLSNERDHKYNLIWKKGERTSGFLNANRMPLRNHEDIMVFYKKLPTYNPQFEEGIPLHSRGSLYLTKPGTNNNYGKFDSPEDKRKGETKKYPKSILNFDRPHPPVHPTQKPVELLEYLIKTYTNEEEIILDFTMGSGTTCIAANNTGRRSIGIELNADYYNLAVNRVKENFSGELTINP